MLLFRERGRKRKREVEKGKGTRERGGGKERQPHSSAPEGRGTCVTDIRLTVLAELIKRIDGIA